MANRSFSVVLKHSFIFTVAIGVIAASMSVQERPPQSVLNDLIKGSDLIVLGKIESQFWVVDPEKGGGKTKRLPGGSAITELPDLHQYIKGIENNLRVETVLNTNSKIKPGDLVPIFTEGFGRTESPDFSKSERYVVFLAKMASRVPVYAGTVLLDPSDHSDASRQKGPFDPGSHYSVFRGEWGLFQVTAENAGRVDQFLRRIRASVEGSR